MCSLFAVLALAGLALGVIPGSAALAFGIPFPTGDCRTVISPGGGQLSCRFSG